VHDRERSEKNGLVALYVSQFFSVTLFIPSPL